MYTAYLFGALIIITGEAVALQTDSRQDELGQSVLLRKLQNFERTEANNQTVTWNEILADVLVTKLNIFPDSEDRRVVEKSKSLTTRFVSSVLLLYKSVYDKYKTNDVTQKPDDVVTTTEYDPKKDVEIVDTVIRSENCDGCDLVEPEKSIDRNIMECPEGYFKNNDGNCQDSVSSKIIMAIPRQCPFGYRPDRFGFCRMVFDFGLW